MAPLQKTTVLKVFSEPLKNFILDVRQGCEYASSATRKQNEPPTGVLRRKCSENMQKIYRRTPLEGCFRKKHKKE